MPFDNSREEDLGVAAGAGPFAKLALSAPATDEVLQCLIALREYHSDPANWCSAVGVSGALNDARCIIRGATYITYKVLGADKAFHATADVQAAIKGALPTGALTIIEFNERLGTTHPELLSMYDRAIAARRGELAS